ncbi:hypothetical protein BP5796_00699 [Coleophoma crateriformis]|uniref:SMODS and SLOG-associating 2TM effector domain-containing protein n=1 Tax=Coleophoma crateriformis TaxID=565419 RepID=A0A3D8T8R4_9HELO|nr:hypothetical protein BP5796_00699 [Coleophoma crateriformis]
MSTSTEHTPLLSGAPSPTTTPEQDNSTPTTLSKFRLAIGINTAPNTTNPPSDLESLRKHSSGIYRSVLLQQRRYFLQYHLVEILYYVALLSQLVIGAILASLGPSSRLHPYVITVLGIANSCLAGILALLKGQGLPDRLRKDEFEMRKVQDFIEECECRLAVGDWAENLNIKEVDNLVKQVFERYNVARDTAEMNRPSSYAHQVDTGSSSGHQAVRSGFGQSHIAVGGVKGKSLEIS